jgi:hypothetical protein
LILSFFIQTILCDPNEKFTGGGKIQFQWLIAEHFVSPIHIKNAAVSSRPSETIGSATV